MKRCAVSLRQLSLLLSPGDSARPVVVEIVNMLRLTRLTTKTSLSRTDRGVRNWCHSKAWARFHSPSKV